jgi:hypothetical protein
MVQEFLQDDCKSVVMLGQFRPVCTRLDWLFPATPDLWLFWRTEPGNPDPATLAISLGLVTPDSERHGTPPDLALLHLMITSPTDQ